MRERDTRGDEQKREALRRVEVFTTSTAYTEEIGFGQTQFWAEGITFVAYSLEHLSIQIALRLSRLFAVRESARQRVGSSPAATRIISVNSSPA